MPSDEAKALHEQLKQFAQGVSGDVTLEHRRAGGEMMGQFGIAPEGVEVSTVTVEGMASLWHEPAGVGQDAGVLLYVHGGGYMVGSPQSHSHLVGHVASQAGCKALNIGYRRSPEHAYPAAHEDVAAAYQWLLTRGYQPHQIVIGGDSAGATLAVVTVMNLRDGGQPLPAAGFGLSAWTDMTVSGASFIDNADRDPTSDRDTVQILADAYLAGADPRNPLLSPIFADLSGLPSWLLQASSDEVLAADTTRLADRLGEAGVDVELDLYPGVPHVFQLWVGNLPEADAAVGKLGAWLGSRLHHGADDAAHSADGRGALR